MKIPLMKTLHWWLFDSTICVANLIEFIIIPIELKIVRQNNIIIYGIIE